jgi:TIR domain
MRPAWDEAVAEVFISYSQEVRPLVAPIADRLAELGVDAWFDREIPAGESFGAVIRARLKEAKAVVVCRSPEAIESQWVDSEADYAREQGTYVPVFVAPCALLPPFNRIHTDDLSKWKGEANDQTWIKLVERIAKLIGRDGVAAAARLVATEDEQARYTFARRYPDEPTARKIWSAAEARHRDQFERRMAEAKAAAEARVKAERTALDARLKTAVPAFDIWLADERCGTAKGPKPDPVELIEQAKHGEDQSLRDEIAALNDALSQAKATGAELEWRRRRSRGFPKNWRPSRRDSRLVTAEVQKTTTSNVFATKSRSSGPSWRKQRRERGIWRRRKRRYDGCQRSWRRRKRQNR